ncbi:MAG: HAMP domain-containing protein [Hydrogenophaga sp.]|uniref:ATP-binding protein n=1 Tax=Hydrogenophaga sp. TaxID=1904254 RepID=UPI001A3C3C64|nr:HAMP domain-containing protein [Hydrogenophaga sp.]
MKRPAGLVRQNTVLLALAFIGIELLVVLAFVWMVMLPLARRSADDLAGLMVLSAQTWAELPPATRPVFETELRLRQALLIRPDVDGVSVDEWHPAFFYLLERALAGRVGPNRHLIRSNDESGQEWYWARIPAGDGTLAVGLSSARINSRPLAALLIGLAAGLVVAVGLALVLARRVVAPLARLEQASAQLGQGEAPDLLSETGPREIVALSRRFNAMAIQVRELLSARTTLLAGVSHDLRTPLARMRLALEMLRTQPSASLLDRLERDMELMNRLISNVLDLARGLEQEPATPVDMAALLRELADEHATATRPVQVRCESCVRSVPALALRRALGNLLQNALRYASSGPVELVCKQEGVDFCIGVLDRGPGIPVEQVEAMFQPFRRLEPSRSPRTGGSGLGLAIVRELAVANGWKVSLEARSGGGMAAWLVL